jgi:hypothetical protein
VKAAFTDSVRAAETAEEVVELVGAAVGRVPRA